MNRKLIGEEGSSAERALKQSDLVEGFLGQGVGLFQGQLPSASAFNGWKAAKLESRVFR